MVAAERLDDYAGPIGFDEAPDDAIEAVIRYPELFAEAVVGKHLWSTQRAILHSIGVNPYTAVRSCHSIGKTFLSSLAAWWFILTRRPSIVLTTAPTWHQVTRLLWKEIHLRYAELPPEFKALVPHKPGACQVKLGPGHRIYGLSTDQPDRFQGEHGPHLMVLVDEASGVSDEIYEAIASLEGGGEYRELLIGNPLRAEGHFYRAFTDGDLGYNCFAIAADQTPNFTGEDVPAEVAQSLLTPRVVERWGSEWGVDSPAYIARVKGAFPEQSVTDVLVPLLWFDQARYRQVCQASPLDVQIGVDIASHGAARTAGSVRVGYELVTVRSLAGELSVDDNVNFIVTLVEDTRTLLNKRKLLGKVDHFDVVIDRTGVGIGTSDRLAKKAGRPQTYTSGKLEGATIRGVAFSEAPLDKTLFAGLRDEALWSVRRWVQPGSGHPDIAITARGPEVDRLQSQGAAIHYTYDDKQRVKVESKTSIVEKRKMPSPDELDSAAMAMMPLRRVALEAIDKPEGL